MTYMRGSCTTLFCCSRRPTTARFHITRRPMAGHSSESPPISSWMVCLSACLSVFLSLCFSLCQPTVTGVTLVWYLRDAVLLLAALIPRGESSNLNGPLMWTYPLSAKISEPRIRFPVCNTQKLKKIKLRNFHSSKEPNIGDTSNIQFSCVLM